MARLSLRMGKGQGCCVHSTSPSRSRQGTCPWYLSEWEGMGYCLHSTSHSGRGVLCPQYLSQWEGWGSVSTVLLTVGGVGCCVHSTSHSGRGGVLCPQYLSQWGGVLCPQYPTVGGCRGPVEPDPGPWPQEVQDLAVQCPARPTTQPPPLLGAVLLSPPPSCGTFSKRHACSLLL